MPGGFRSHGLVCMSPGLRYNSTLPSGLEEANISEKKSVVNFIGFADRLNVRKKKREELRKSPEFLAWGLGD